MLHWVQSNWGTILISMVVLAVVCAIVVGRIKSRRKNGSSCGCGCAGCAMSGACHPKK